MKKKLSKSFNFKKNIPALLLLLSLVTGFYLLENSGTFGFGGANYKLAAAADSLGDLMQAKNQNKKFDGPADVSGKLIVEVADDFDNKVEKYSYYVHDAVRDKIFSIQGRVPEGLKTGDKVKIKGKIKNSVLSIDEGADLEQGGSSAFEVLESADLPALVDKNTLVLIGNFNDKTVGSGCTTEGVANYMFNNSNSVREFYIQASEGKVTFHGDVYGPYTIDYSYTGTSYYTWGQALKNAAQADGIDINQYDNFLFILPKSGVSYAGVAQIGGNQAWSFYCNSHSLATHEIGHNLGFNHASTESDQYGDASDPMGRSSSGGTPEPFFNSAHKAQLGWISGSKVVEIKTPGTYTIAPLDQSSALSSLPQVLKIAKPDSSGTYYYISYRRPYGFSSGLGSGYKDKVNIHRQSYTSSTYFLGGLADGTSFTDNANGIKITQVAVDGNQAVVNVSLVCTSSSPSITVSPTSASGASGTTREYNVNIKNNDGLNCGDTSFNMSVSDKDGWDTSVANGTILIPAGNSKSTVVSITPIQSVSEGLNTFTVTADGGVNHSASTAVSYYVDNTAPSTPTNLSLSTSGKGKNITKQISWNASTDNVRVVKYDVYLNGSILTSVSTNSYSSKSLANGNYAVRAVDESGNVSNLSEELVVSDSGTDSGTGKTTKCSPWPDCNKR